MSSNEPTQEQRILAVMRKTLTNIVRDTTPQPGMKSPLSESSVDDIRSALALISARERELLQDAGVDNAMRPRFTDEPQTAHVVSIDSIKKR